MMFLSKAARNWEAVETMVPLAAEIEADKMVVCGYLCFEQYFKLLQ